MVEPWGPIAGVLASLGPPRLFEGADPEGAAGGPWLVVIGFGLCVLLALGVVRGVRRRLTGDERLAFVLLARRLGLKPRQRAAVERLASRAGVEPVALLVCESAFVRSARGERIRPGSETEAKPVLLTGAELVELGRVAERLFGRGCLEQYDGPAEEHEEEDTDETSQWVA